MPAELQVYLLDPQKISPETIAVTFAKTSRSPQSFHDIAEELTDEKSAEFHEKWVVGYGHASVAEHAVLHIAIENLSRLAVEALESSRLASFTEKSTRYQKWDAGSFFIPEELDGHPLRDLYAQTCEHLFDAYLQSLEPVRAYISKASSRREGETEAAWDRRIRSEYVDVCRFFLPAASLANIGMTINARELEHAICKFLTHQLAEVRALGNKLKEVAQAEVPTLVKYAHEVPYLENTAKWLSLSARQLPEENPAGGCRLVNCDNDIENRLLAAALYRYSNNSYTQVFEAIKEMEPRQLEELASTLVCGLGTHGIPIRELEHGYFTFDIVMDQGAYAELKRHRMMTQSAQPFSPDLGFALPSLISAAGLEHVYFQAMQAAGDSYKKIAAFNPEVAAYVLPNGFNRRVLITLNLRSAYHFIRLRTAPQAHFSIRRVAGQIAEQIAARFPLLKKLPGLEPTESWQELEGRYFSSTQIHI